MMEKMVHRDMTGWQPIETAPRDETVVKLAHRKSIASYDTTGFFRNGKWLIGSWFVLPGLMISSAPTHWKPYDIMKEMFGDI